MDKENRWGMLVKEPGEREKKNQQLKKKENIKNLGIRVTPLHNVYICVYMNKFQKKKSIQRIIDKIQN